METFEPLVLAAQLAMGITLAACAGLRAFLPPLALGVAARAGLLDLSPDFAWLASTPCLVVLGSAVVVELLGDKVPVVDHFLDVAGTVLRPAAGALVATVPLFSLVPMGPDASPAGAAPWILGLAGIATGATVSAGVHVAKSHLRLGSTALTAGAGNPVLSFIEDLTGISGVILAILLPLIALGLLIMLMTLVVLVAARRRRVPHHGG